MVNGDNISGDSTTTLIRIGFSIDPMERLMEHCQHRSSDYIMDLAEVLFKFADPDSSEWFTPATGLHGSSEVLTLSGSFCTKGAGVFSHYTASRSNGSAYGKTRKDQFMHQASRSGELDAGLERMVDEAGEVELTARQERCLGCRTLGQG